MIAKKIPVLFFIFVFTPFFYGEELKVAAVQLEISTATYESETRFFGEMEERVREAVDTFQPDLIIFPEYTSVFPAVTPYFPFIEGSRSIEEIFGKIHAEDKSVRSLRDLFIAQSDRMESLVEGWGELASRYDVTILGGTYFAYREGRLTNRLIVFGPSGSRVYEQDKFFLTDFETDIVGLEPGSSDEPEGFWIKDRKVVFTICRDTFLDRWESMYGEADLWIDIKANGERYGEEQVALFARALPARMANTTARYGSTVCLTGSFLELFWEGETSFIAATDEGVHTFITSETADSGDIVYFVVD